MTFSRTILAAALGAAAIGCGTSPLADGISDEVRCRDCHGSERNNAPPEGLHGATATSDPAVGAHQIHLRDGLVRKAVACSECHVVPDSVEQQGHADGLPAEVTFGPLASTEEASPRWDRSQGTCASVYCHGATLAGGTRTSPSWTFDQPPAWLQTVQEETCEGCHGSPPPAPHPAGDRCATCHPGTVRSDGTIDLEGGRHIDGEIEGED